MVRRRKRRASRWRRRYQAQPSSRATQPEAQEAAAAVTLRPRPARRAMARPGTTDHSRSRSSWTAAGGDRPPTSGSESRPARVRGSGGARLVRAQAGPEGLRLRVSNAYVMHNLQDIINEGCITCYY